MPRYAAVMPMKSQSRGGTLQLRTAASSIKTLCINWWEMCSNSRHQSTVKDRVHVEALKAPEGAADEYKYKPLKTPDMTVKGSS